MAYHTLGLPKYCRNNPLLNALEIRTIRQPTIHYAKCTVEYLQSKELLYVYAKEI